MKRLAVIFVLVVVGLIAGLVAIYGKDFDSGRVTHRGEAKPLPVPLINPLLMLAII